MPALLLVASPLSAAAAALMLSAIAYQGRLMDSSGLPRSGNVDLRFALFDALTGSAIRCEEQASITLTDGYHSLFLAEGTAPQPAIDDISCVRLRCRKSISGAHGSRTSARPANEGRLGSF